MQILLIAFFGVAGVLCRYGVDQLVGATISAGSFPLGTFLINMAGCFLAGLIYVLGERQEISPLLQLSLLVGFCGGFTTFSAYALQSFVLLDREKSLMAMAYLFGSPVLGLLVAALPIILIRRWV